jgi:hypothetical protein
VITAVLGAPGSGKSAVAQPLAALLPNHVVLDWDIFMKPAAALAGREIIGHPETWLAYRQLVGTVVAAIAHLPVVLLTVCTPDELPGWPIGAWVLIDRSACRSLTGLVTRQRKWRPHWPGLCATWREVTADSSPRAVCRIGHDRSIGQ